LSTLETRHDEHSKHNPTTTAAAAISVHLVGLIRICWFAFAHHLFVRSIGFASASADDSDVFRRQRFRSPLHA
jgi:hypothetical protein